MLFAFSAGCEVGKAPPAAGRSGLSLTGVLHAEFPCAPVDSPKTARVRAGGTRLCWPAEARGAGERAGPPATHGSERRALLPSPPARRGALQRSHAAVGVHGRARVCTGVHGRAALAPAPLPTPATRSVTSAACSSRPKPVSAGTQEVGETDRQSKPRGER